ncbi:MAG: 50S ribosomal protein L5 [Elusimicrobiota bacterium]|jgi:large subunit ribosomal protein L5|nr:50S ribosomal protein L5 [Elusimicrobiota bacterium]
MKYSRLKELYQQVVAKELKERYRFKNIFQVPKLSKIVVNVGLSEAKDNIKVLDVASTELAAITGQKPSVCRSRKSISNFKIREGMPIGIKVTLRDIVMYEFLDRLINVAIPRIRDFRGVNTTGFDGNGNFNFGITEQYIFPEVDVEKSDKTRGMNITVVTTSLMNEHAITLLELLGMPFKKKSK